MSSSGIGLLSFMTQGAMESTKSCLYNWLSKTCSLCVRSASRRFWHCLFEAHHGDGTNDGVRLELVDVVVGGDDLEEKFLDRCVTNLVSNCFFS